MPQVFPIHEHWNVSQTFPEFVCWEERIPLQQKKQSYKLNINSVAMVIPNKYALHILNRAYNITNKVSPKIHKPKLIHECKLDSAQ